MDIPFMLHKRLERSAIERFGRAWTPTHDRWVVNQLFKHGTITDFQRSEHIEKIDDLERSARARNPNYGRFRLY